MRPMISDAQGGILRAICDFFEKDQSARDYPSVVVEAASSESWASVTFTGHRHHLELSFEGGGVERVDSLMQMLTSAELVVPGHIVVDIAMIAHEIHDGHPPRHKLSLEALTVAD